MLLHNPENPRYINTERKIQLAYTPFQEKFDDFMLGFLDSYPIREMGRITYEITDDRIFIMKCEDGYLLNEVWSALMGFVDGFHQGRDFALKNSNT